MKANFYGRFFRFLQWFVRIFYPKYSVKLPNNPTGPVVYVSHHQNLFGPFIILLWFPRCLHAWILHVFIDQRACYKQYVDYTFTKRFGWNKTLAKVCAFSISFFIARLLNSGKGIPVYRGTRKILDTMGQSVASLSKGESIVLFPDIDYSDGSSHTKDMYEGFLYLEKYYYKVTGEHICFIPLYVSKRKRMVIADQPIYFQDGNDFISERKLVHQKIFTSLNDLAKRCGD